MWFATFSTTTPFWGQGFLQALTPELKPSSLGSGLGFGMQPRPGPLEQCVRPRLGVYEGGARLHRARIRRNGIHVRIPGARIVSPRRECAKRWCPDLRGQWASALCTNLPQQCGHFGQANAGPQSVCTANPSHAVRESGFLQCTKRGLAPVQNLLAHSDAGECHLTDRGSSFHYRNMQSIHSLFLRLAGADALALPFVATAECRAEIGLSVSKPDKFVLPFKNYVVNSGDLGFRCTCM